MNDDELDKLFNDAGSSDDRKETKGKKKPSGKASGSFVSVKERLLKLKDDILVKIDVIRKQKASEPKNEIPLKDREYLPGFPLSFRAVLRVYLVLTVLIAIFDVVMLPSFRVKNIEVDGNIVLSSDRIIEESGIKKGSHILSGLSGNPLDIIRLRYGDTEEKLIADDPYIKDIIIRASYPSTVKIKVEERNKIACIKMPDGYAAIDEEGTVIELTTLADDGQSHAVICGLEVAGAVKGEKIAISNESDYNKALVVLGSIITADATGAGDYSLFSNIKELRIIPGGNIFLSVMLPNGSQLQVQLKNIEGVQEAMESLRYAIIKDAFDGLTNGSLDMTGDYYIYRVTD